MCGGPRSRRALASACPCNPLDPAPSTPSPSPGGCTRQPPAPPPPTQPPPPPPPLPTPQRDSGTESGDRVPRRVAMKRHGPTPGETCPAPPSHMRGPRRPSGREHPPLPHAPRTAPPSRGTLRRLGEPREAHGRCRQASGARPMTTSVAGGPVEGSLASSHPSPRLVLRRTRPQAPLFPREHTTAGQTLRHR